LTANPTEVQRTTLRDAKEKDCKTLFFIQQNVETNHDEKISKVTRSKEIWDILDMYYDGNEKVNRMKLQSLRRKYELMSREEDRRVND